MLPAIAVATAAGDAGTRKAKAGTRGHTSSDNGSSEGFADQLARAADLLPPGEMAARLNDFQRWQDEQVELGKQIAQTEAQRAENAVELSKVKGRAKELEKEDERLEKVKNDLVTNLLDLVRGPKPGDQLRLAFPRKPAENGKNGTHPEAARGPAEPKGLPGNWTGGKEGRYTLEEVGLKRGELSMNKGALETMHPRENKRVKDPAKRWEPGRADHVLTVKGREYIIVGYSYGATTEGGGEDALLMPLYTPEEWGNRPHGVDPSFKYADAGGLEIGTPGGVRICGPIDEEINVEVVPKKGKAAAEALVKATPAKPNESGVYADAERVKVDVVPSAKAKVELLVAFCQDGKWRGGYRLEYVGGSAGAGVSDKAPPRETRAGALDWAAEECQTILRRMIGSSRAQCFSRDKADDALKRYRRELSAELGMRLDDVEPAAPAAAAAAEAATSKKEAKKSARKGK